MKAQKYITLSLVIIVGAQLLTACSGYIVATAPPPPPEEIIYVAPSPRYVWVPGYYHYNGAAYVWIQGSYQVPPPGRREYVQSQWMRTPKGFKRGKGHWK